jgi:hypothetical protein
MMKKIKLIKIICFLFCFAILCFSEDFYELKNKGIKFIKKGKHVYGQINLNFSEKTLIQESEKDENYMFSRIVDIKVDKEENIYIIDFKRVLKYDKNGIFKKKIGRTGQGLGEFYNPMRLFIDKSNNLYIMDFRRLIKYSPDSYYIFSFKISRTITNDFFVGKSDNELFAPVKKYSEKGVYESIVLLNLNEKKEKDIYSFINKEVFFKGNKRGGVMGGVYHPYSKKIFLSHLKYEKICFAENSTYKIYLSDLSGNIKSIIYDNKKQEKISNKEIEWFRKKYGKRRFEIIRLPKYRPILENMLTDELGRIYIFKKKSVLNKSKRFNVDIFSKDGVFLYKAAINKVPKIIYNGYTYYIENDNEGRYIIKKAKINNYKKIKHN